MAKEVRCILFSPDEVHLGVAEYLTRKLQNQGPFMLERVELSEAAGAVVGDARSVREPRKPIALDLGELMSALLLYCRRARIPLPCSATKRLERSGAGLVLTMALNVSNAQTRAELGVVLNSFARETDIFGAGPVQVSADAGRLASV